ncbi:hypothetical protein NEIMUCOT_03591 [Neisseria mucosa ATCC 25996]|uniref:Uncharacterized protein n=1 Tax=Neisseria mucosa (strain ATCC 25996 / DSM 4631 / NCTC 10774 / M26) TaxID=546266 RepID=D2ZSK9_NEIM2|nr:hypothetical protein NEIMUCOT_03591 [Neisseria mucosa ATCC 25996]
MPEYGCRFYVIETVLAKRSSENPVSSFQTTFSTWHQDIKTRRG